MRPPATRPPLRPLALAFGLLSLAFAALLGVPAALAADTYLVVDLSGGTNAVSYPVSTLSAVPVGGWTDEHKTDKLVLRKIPAGTFTMGSPTDELGRDGDETQHEVTLTQDFYIGVFEVTQRQWELVMGNNPSYLHNYATRPVEKVSYFDIRENPDNSAIGPNWPATNAVHAGSFMGKLRTKTGLATFDLPTESQWEYACRAGTPTALNSGKNLASIDSDANVTELGRYWHNGGYWTDARQWDPTGGTALVGSYLPNQWGLYDMHGNVDEWCLDWYGTYPGAVGDPAGATSGSHRVARGSGWNANANGCRSAHRNDYVPESRMWVSLGLRVCSAPPGETDGTTHTVALSISSAAAPGLMDLTVRNSAIGSAYELQTSTNLVSWEPLRQVTGRLAPHVICVETGDPYRFYRLSISTVVEPWSFFIDGNVLYDARDGQQRLFRGLAFSGLEYGKVTHDDTPLEYPGDEGQEYYAPTQATFDLVRDLGANCVRLPFDWGRLVQGVADYQPGTPVTFDSEYLGHLQDAVRWARERDLFVILDLHNSLEYAASRTHLIRVDENTSYRALLAETWRALARQFGTYPNVLGYEIVNEPNPQSGESNWPAIAQEIINAIREVDSRRIVFIDGSDYSGAQQWVIKSDALRDLTDSADRLVYAPHLYVDRYQNGTCDSGDEQPGANWQYDVYEDVRGIVAWSREVQRPVLFTEFGFLSLYNAWDPVLQELLTEYLDFHGIGAILWNLETDIDGNNQATYAYGGTGYVIGTYSNHVNVPYEGAREGYILADNLHNGFDLDIWNDSSDPGQDWARCLKDGMGAGGGVALSLSGSNWGGGVNILHRDAQAQQTSFDVSGYESLSFMHRGAGVLVWVEDAQSTEFPKYTVPSHDAYTRVTIPLAEMLGPEPRLNYIKIQIMNSGSVLLDEIVLE